MRRDQCFQILADVLAEDIVVATYSSAFEWMHVRPHPLNYFCVGAMGLASSHGLGLALGLPHKRIVVLDGDGSLLMNLGTLASAAAAGPTNLYHFVCQNGTYEANGGHPLVNAEHINFSDIARGAGYRHVEAFSEIEDFGSRIASVLTGTGPSFITLKIEAGPTPTVPDYAYIHSLEARETFKNALAVANPTWISRT